MINSNLPTNNTASSSQEIKEFFDRFFTSRISFPATEIDAVMGFFLKRDFDMVAARSIAIILLNQARIDNVKVFELLDTLKALTDVQMSQVVAQVLNAYREKTSVLGYRVGKSEDSHESRNILI